MTKLRIERALLVLLILFSSDLRSSAKELRGIFPLKSTRTDVERLLGRPNELGRYQFSNEKAVITYSNGPCDRKENCACLASKDTVLSIFVIPEYKIRFSQIGVDKSKYQKFKSSPHLPSTTYTNSEEGLRYMVNERLDSVDNIEFLPAASDCKELLARQTMAALTNEWHGIRPLSSNKTDVDKLLGSPKASVAQILIYETANEKVHVRYAKGNCQPGYETWNVPSGTVISIEVAPKSTLLVRDLNLDKTKYKREQKTHPDNIVDYTNLADGLNVHAIVINGCEEVLSFIYGPKDDDVVKQCPKKNK